MSDLDTIAGLRISLASSEQIRSWSCGQVTKPDTINYLTNRPEPDGLFCERIFGPLEDWTCACGKYRHERAPGSRCDICGVEIAPGRVRRERMGHIELVVPVVHSWLARGTPGILATLLALSPRQLASVLAYRGYLVTEVNPAYQTKEKRLSDGKHEADQEHSCFLHSLTPGHFLDEERYQELALFAGVRFRAQTGAEAVRQCLNALDLEALAASLRQTLEQKRGNHKKVIKRLHLVEAFRRSGIPPSWAVLDVIPVLPPDLRPLVHLGGGRLAISDLNTLYERVIHRNIRVRHFLAHGAPEALLKYEKRLLQEACDALFDNAHQPRPLARSRKQPLKSLTDTLTGKQGRFRRNLLGKRVDYSGRSVICVGLDLKLHECGLPKKIALELFKPFVMRKLLDRHLARTPREAKRLIEARHQDVWDQLAECLHEKVVLLNRAPTLHRLSLQAFEARLVEGDAIRLHPLVCSAFNADFDGDQMAVHLPLSDEAQAEARRLMLSVHNLRSPATGEPAISLAQDIVLGCFYLTEDRPGRKPAGHVFTDANEARLAYEQGIIDLHTRISVRLPGQHIAEAPPPTHPSSPPRGRVETTLGRLLFNELLPSNLGYRNYAMTKECLKQILAESLERCGEESTARLADAIKRLGYQFATRSGISFAISDIQEPPQKQYLVAQGQARTQEIQHAYLEGTMTQEERDQHIIALWTATTEQISQKLLETLDPWGTISTIVKSGATKARFQQIRQLSGIRGLMADPSGRIIPIPVLGNYLRGLQTWELFIAGSGARKGFMDRSLNTAQSGYLTRKLVEVGMEVWTTQEDCGTADGWLITNEESQALGLPDLRSRVVGRILAEPVAGIQEGTSLGEQHIEVLLARGITSLRVRSPLTCQADYGICCRCYGQDLATGKLVQRGVAVGIIAGQSIGEPGTQLTMRTFHSGGIAHAQGDITQGLPRISELFEARVPRRAALLADSAGTIHIMTQPDTEKTVICIRGEASSDASSPVLKEYELLPDHTLLVEESQTVAPGTPLTTGALDPRRLLHLQGREATARYLIKEVQQIYRATGVFLNEKHFEVIVRQMLRYVQLTDPGDTSLVPGEVIDRFRFLQTNAHILAQGGEPARAHPVLPGLTRAALLTSSWIAAASFQETSNVLINAAIRRQVDPLRGYKERIVLGARIPQLTR